jgi:hypothetical protein
VGPIRRAGRIHTGAIPRIGRRIRLCEDGAPPPELLIASTLAPKVLEVALRVAAFAFGRSGFGSAALAFGPLRPAHRPQPLLDVVH